MTGPIVLSVAAPAKINLHLEILGIRADGFHDIRSLFCMVDLCDRITVTAGVSADSWEMTGGEALDPHHNSLVRALALFRERTGMTDRVSLKLSKKIPLGAGLGGGSSDAAAVLRLLNQANGRSLAEAALAELGSRIGSDVPFFLGGACAVVEGRGETVRPCPGPAGLSIALVVPDFPVWTAEAYRAFDQASLPQSDGPSPAELAEAVRSVDPARWRFFNSFAGVILPRFPEYESIRKVMSSGGALYHGLSGSGSSYFGIFDDQNRAAACLGNLTGTFRFTGVVHPSEALPAFEGE